MSRHWLRAANWKRWGALLLLAGTLKLALPLAADEPPTSNSTQPAIQLAFEAEANVAACPLTDALARIPYLSRLFKTQAGTGVERIGVDFDFAVQGPESSVTTPSGVMLPTFVFRQGNGVAQVGYFVAADDAQTDDDCCECEAANVAATLFPWTSGKLTACESSPACQSAPACKSGTVCASVLGCQPANAKSAACKTPAACAAPVCAGSCALQLPTFAGPNEAVVLWTMPQGAGHACDANGGACPSHAACASAVSGTMTARVCTGCQGKLVCGPGPVGFPGNFPVEFEFCVPEGACMEMCESSDEDRSIEDLSRLDLIEEIVRLSVEGAKHQAAAEFGRERDQMIEKLVSLSVENAKLQASAELQKERERTLEKFVELSVKNARLETQLEQMREQLAHVERTTALAIENAHLKSMVAQLNAARQSPVNHTAQPWTQPIAPAAYPVPMAPPQPLPVSPYGTPPAPTPVYGPKLHPSVYAPPALTPPLPAPAPLSVPPPPVESDARGN